MRRINPIYSTVLACFALTCVLGVSTADGQQFKTHTVQQGDTLYRIARTNLVTVQSLRVLNQIENDHIEPGQKLWIDGKPEELPLTAESDSLMQNSVDSLAQNINVAVDTVASTLDSLEDDVDEKVSDAPTDSTLYGGEVVYYSDIADRIVKPTEPADSELVIDASDISAIDYANHVVAAGETVFAVAELYGVSSIELVQANPTFATFLEAGDTLRIPWAGQLGSHHVASGETLFRISKKYSTTVRRIQELNDIADASIRVGQKLVVPIGPKNAATHIESTPNVVAVGVIGMYPEIFEGRLMANGSPYRPEKFTVSHGSLELGTVVLLVDPLTGNQSFAEVTDRLPAGSDVVMEVSKAVYELLASQDAISEIEIRMLR